MHDSRLASSACCLANAAFGASAGHRTFVEKYRRRRDIYGLAVLLSVQASKIRPLLLQPIEALSSKCSWFRKKPGAEDNDIGAAGSSQNQLP